MQTALPNTIIPATPGYYTLHAITDGNRKVVGFQQSPVIAWRIEAHPYETGENFTIPVTIENQSEDNRAILCPDGRVRLTTEEYPTLSDWYASLRGE